jgi:hypothetical protein
MKHLTYFLAAGALMVSATACANGRLASVTLVDRDSGAVLTTHYYRGEYWVAGRPGARYAIEIRNATGARLLAVTSVDGVNVLSGATAGWDQSGYVFDPGERYQISGWRKSNSEVAAFTFTDSSSSYAARTGRPGSIGVIGIALFREATPVYGPPKVAQLPPRAEDAESAARESRALAGADAATAAAPSVRTPAPPAKLGTGHGEREYSYVVDTEFRRAQSEPNEVIRIRYDSLDNLIALGVIRRPRPLPPGPDPFPGSPQREYVPDPPSG